MGRVFKPTEGGHLAKYLTTLYHKAEGYPLSKIVGSSSSKIDFKELDKKWITKWKATTGNKGLNPRKLVKPDENKRMFVLSMFPYPSGELHIGHLRVYTISDTIARYYRMNGYSVLHPMGFDAFGLPAENAAIERGANAEDWTRGNIAKMKVQMNQMFADFDWDKEVITCDKEYYHWTQKLFLLMFEHGLAYRDKAEINWDPIDQTVLANEQVDENGRSWRSGALVEKKLLEQWFLGITQYASELNKDLQLLEKWPNKVKSMQKNWIGESHGAEIKFKRSGSAETIDVFTTRAETIFGVQYLALSFDHPIVKALTETDKELLDFISTLNKDTSAKDSKAGYLLDEVKVVNPITGAELPVFTAPYVLGGYGHGAVMGVPAHDTRDFDFWKQNQLGKCDVIKVIDAINQEQEEVDASIPYTSKEGLMNSRAGDLEGLQTTEAREQIINKLREIEAGGSKIQYRVRDWLISRQRYWGAPIPIIHCTSCGPVAVPDKDLPVELPRLETISQKGGSPLAQIPEFVNCKCPKCGQDAKRDTDTMDTFMDSSWYMFRYPDAKNPNMIFDKEKVDKFLPVNLYIGGLEHAILHLLYTRFMAKFLYKIGYWGKDAKSPGNGEPIDELLTQGMVHGKSFLNPENGVFLKPDEYDLNEQGKAVLKSNGLIAREVYEKMSKSKYNGADPVACILRNGADATRAHILFQAPVSEILDWEEDTITGVDRLLKKIIGLNIVLGDLIDQNVVESARKSLNEYTETEREIHNKFQKIIANMNEIFTKTYDMNNLIPMYSNMTSLLFSAIDNEDVSLPFLYDNMVKLIKVISPVAPATAEESYEMLNYKLTDEIYQTSILSADWPAVEEMAVSETKDLNIYINGKPTFVITVGSDTEVSKDNILEIISRDSPENHATYIKDESLVRKVAVLPDRIIIVVPPSSKKTK